MKLFYPAAVKTKPGGHTYRLAQQRRLIEAVAESNSFVPRNREGIAARSDGVPLFAEE